MEKKQYNLMTKKREKENGTSEITNMEPTYA